MGSKMRNFFIFNNEKICFMLSKTCFEKPNVLNVIVEIELYPGLHKP